MARRRRGTRAREDWRIWLAAFKLALLVGVLGATAFYAYEVGQRLSLEEIARLKQDIEGLTATLDERQSEAERLRAELAATRVRADDLQSRYDRVAPTEEMKDILAQVRAKLDSGLDPKRLAFLVSAAQPPRRCGEEASKRFMVKTPRYDGNSTWVRFADLITVTAEGAGGNDGAEQWFDPERPVSVRFTAIGGKDAQVTGKLPLQHSMIVKNGEYRFTVIPGARGFVEVTGDRCEYKG